MRNSAPATAPPAEVAAAPAPAPRPAKAPGKPARTKGFSALGVNKINISSDIKAAYYKKMREVLKDESLREPNMIEPPCIMAMRAVAQEKIKLFQDDGKADLY